MSKPLTKNARWIVLWARYQSNDVIGFKPHETVFNIGRWSYDVPTTKAINESLAFKDSKILASKVYLVDVQLFPYAKQHKDVTQLAEQYFNKRRIVT